MAAEKAPLRWRRAVRPCWIWPFTSVQLVPASYKVTYKVNNEQGKLLVGKDTEEKTDGEISAAYGTSIKFTAVSNKFCHIKGWKLEGTEVTDTTKERRLPIQIRSVRRERYTDIL